MPYKDPLAQKTYKRLWDVRNRDKRLAYDRHRRTRTKELIASLRAEIQRLRARIRARRRGDKIPKEFWTLDKAKKFRGPIFLTRTLDRK